ncbi:hypothetical protein [Cupriavidus pauculus]
MPLVPISGSQRWGSGGAGSAEATIVQPSRGDARNTVPPAAPWH